MPIDRKLTISDVYHRYFYAILLVLILLAAAFFMLSYLVLAPWSSDMRQVAMVLLGALIAIVIRELVLGGYYNQINQQAFANALLPPLTEEIQRILPQIKNETVQSIDDIRERVAEASKFMLTGIGVLSGAKASGIINIFPTRYDKISGQSVIDVISQDMENETATIKLMGISLGDFFLDRGVLHKKLHSLLESSSSTCRINALLVHPQSIALRERARWEAGPDYFDEPAFWDSTTFIETDGAARIARRLCQRGTNRIEVKLYHQAPTMFLLLTTRFAFVEGYSYAARGSNVPILQVQAGTQLYKHFDSHFERIWKVAEAIDGYDPLKPNPSRTGAAKKS